jgi:hypothetical protein
MNISTLDKQLSWQTKSSICQAGSSSGLAGIIILLGIKVNQARRELNLSGKKKLILSDSKQLNLSGSGLNLSCCKNLSLAASKLTTEDSNQPRLQAARR